ncbi:hypothetical protein ACFWJU_06065 [Streptomyces mutabilis]|uniref:hypothetical protein n=1 Tax=Streptomyces mutabilis TaxID=67332 RepID=UPI003656C262
MTGEQRRLEALRAMAGELLAALPAWSGESQYLLVTVIDPETHDRIGHRFVPVADVPAVRHLRLVREAS